MPPGKWGGFSVHSLQLKKPEWMNEHCHPMEETESTNCLCFTRHNRRRILMTSIWGPGSLKKRDLRGGSSGGSSGGGSNDSSSEEICGDTNVIGDYYDPTGVIGFAWGVGFFLITSCVSICSVCGLCSGKKKVPTWAHEKLEKKWCQPGNKNAVALHGVDSNTDNICDIKIRIKCSQLPTASSVAQPMMMGMQQQPGMMMGGGMMQQQQQPMMMMGEYGGMQPMQMQQQQQPMMMEQPMMMVTEQQAPQQPVMMGGGMMIDPNTGLPVEAVDDYGRPLGST